MNNTANDSLVFSDNKSEDIPELNDQEERECADKLLTDAGTAYLNKISGHTLLTAAEEKELSRRILEEKSIEARDKLVAHSLLLVAFVARNWYPWSPLPFEDLVQEGNLGLIAAAERFDYKMNVRFSSYAVPWIRQTMGQAIYDKADVVRIPKDVRTGIRKVRTAFNKKGGASLPSAQAIADELGFSREEAETIVYANSLSYVSLQTPTGNTGDESLNTLQDTVVDETIGRADTQLEAREELIAFCEQMKQLPKLILRATRGDERSLSIFLRYYGLSEDEGKVTLERLGAEYGVSCERIRQINAKTFSSLKKMGILLTPQEIEGYAEQLHGLKEIA